MNTFFDPVAESVVVELHPGIDGTGSITPLLPPGWTSAPIAGLAGWWEALPPGGEATPALAWDLAAAIATHPSVRRAEPSLRVKVAGDPSATPLEGLGGGVAGVSDDALDWAPDMVRARQAWAWSAEHGVAARGSGIRIAHPDSGWLLHDELGDRIELPALDLVNSADDGMDTDGSGHGLATASVIASPVGGGALEVVGIAPGSRLWPMRVTRRHLGLPAPILFADGARRLRDALCAVADSQDTRPCGVVSISLGWFGDAALHAAVKRCFEAGVIVVAAAGNYTGIVVWPAAYPEVIACAGCDSTREVWPGSARGAAVDVTGPAHGVFRATLGVPPVAPSSGTSYATATVAGIAALWLAHHGESVLRQRYPGGALPRAFRTVLRATAGAVPTKGGQPVTPGLFGAGIVDARACIEAQLPLLDQLEGFGPGDSAELPILDALSAQSGQPVAPLRTNLAALLRIPEARVDDALAAHGREIVSAVLTDPAARQLVLAPPAPAVPAGLEPLGGAGGPVVPPLSGTASRRLEELRA